MPEVLISFVDGEVIHAQVDDLSFDLPIISAEIQSIDPNCELALFPLAGIRELIVGQPEAAPEDLESWDRSAFHFLDGQVLRGWIAPDATLGQHGGIWRMAEPGGGEVKTLAIPYCALKGVYRLRQWDSRLTSERTTHNGPRGGAEQLARVLAERDQIAQAEETPKAQPLISRMHKKSQ